MKQGSALSVCLVATIKVNAYLQMYGRITSTKSLLFGVTTFSASLTYLTAHLPESHDRKQTNTGAWSWRLWGINPAVHRLNVGRGSIVGIVTRYGLDGPRTESRWGRYFPPPQPPVQWLSGLFPEGQASGAWRYPLTPIQRRGWRKCRTITLRPLWAFMAC